MAISVAVPKDLSGIKTKVALNGRNQFDLHV